MSLETLPNPEFYPEWKDWANALLREIKSEPEPSLNSDSISAFDESAQDAVGLALTDTGTVNLTYDDALHQISAIVIDDSISNAKLANMVQATFKMRAAGAGTGDPIDGTAAQAKTALAITAADLSDFAEAVQDTVGAAAADSATIDFTYDDGAGTLTADVKADSITYALLQNVSATARLLGRITAGAGDTEELTGTQATTLLNVFTDALKGLAPASGGGTDNFLRADGTWDEPPGTGGAGWAPTVPEAADFPTIRGSGSPAIADLWEGGVEVSITRTTGATIQISMVLQAAPAGDWRIEARLTPIFSTDNNTVYKGLCASSAADTGRSVYVFSALEGAIPFENVKTGYVEKSTSLAGVGGAAWGTLDDYIRSGYADEIWYALEWDESASTFSAYYSYDGYAWHRSGQDATDYFGANTPDQVGFMFLSLGTDAGTEYMDCSHFYVTGDITEPLGKNK